jgi:putative transposase
MAGNIHPVALFRLSVLGPLASREELERGEIKSLIREVASRTYSIPNSNRIRIAEGTIEAWYYAWKRGESRLYPLKSVLTRENQNSQ